MRIFHHLIFFATLLLHFYTFYLFLHGSLNIYICSLAATMSLSKFSTNFSPSMPPMPDHHFDMGNSADWPKLVTLQVPIFDVKSRPFWARLSAHTPHITLMCRQCSNGFLDMLTFQFYPHVDAIPTSLYCMCAELQPHGNSIYIPATKLSHFQAAPGVQRRYKHTPSLLLPYTPEQSPGLEIGQSYPLGKTLPLGDPMGSPEFTWEDERHSLRFPPTGEMGIAPYLSQAHQFFTWVSPLLPKQEKSRWLKLPQDLQLVHNFISDAASLKERFTRGLVDKPVAKQEIQYARETVIIRFHQRQKEYHFLMQSMESMAKFLFRIEALVDFVEMELPQAWVDNPIYRDVTMQPWHPKYLDTISTSVRYARRLNNLLQAAHVDRVYDQPHIELKELLDGIWNHVDSSDIAPRTGTHQILDDVFHRIHQEMLQSVADLAHGLARISRKTFFCLHAYSTAYYALLNETLSPFATGQMTYDPMKDLSPANDFDADK